MLNHSMHIAIEGCCHGELDAIYASIQKGEREKGIKVDLLLMCGDFQALRNPHDFESLAVPQKFRNLGSFHSYYSGQKVAPILTIVIGGNHEASNYMWELYHGGWLAPNIYYLGTSGSVLVNGLRVSGASGIFKSHDYHKGFFETVPYDRSTLRSVYHIRHHSISKLLLLPPSEEPNSLPQVFLSHDWPLSISKHGDLSTLLRRKPFFKQEIEENTLGSPPLLEVLKRLKPGWWFSAHLHVKFAAVWRHSIPERVATIIDPRASQRNPDEILLDEDEDEDGDEGEEAEINRLLLPPTSNPDEIQLDDSDSEPEPERSTPFIDQVDQASSKTTRLETLDLPAEGNPDEIVLDDEEEEEDHENCRGAPSGQEKEVEVVRLNAPVEENVQVDQVTKFLALDKCMPNKDFLQILDIPTANTDSAPTLTFDPDWLAITRAMHPYLSTNPHAPRLPSEDHLRACVEKEKRWVEANGLGWREGSRSEGKANVGDWQKFWKTAPAVGEPAGGPASWYTNPQTLSFCTMLQIENKINPVPAGFHAPPLPYDIPAPFSTH